MKRGTQQQQKEKDSDDDDDEEGQELEDKQKGDIETVVDEDEDEGELGNSIITFAAIFNQAKSLIIYTFSLTIFGFIAILPNRLMVTIMTIELLILWSGTDTLVKNILYRIKTLTKRNRVWYETINNMVNSVSTLGVYLIVQLFLAYLTATWSNGSFNKYETFVVIYIVALGLIALFQKIAFITSSPSF